MAFNNPFRRPPAGPVTLDTSADPVRDSQVLDAYARGKRDARDARKRHPVGMTFLFVAAAVGLSVTAYAVYSGSFAGGGQRLDRDLAVAADKAQPIMREAAHDAGQALKDVSQPRTDPSPPAAPETP
jgi:hypothetical protein